MRARKSGGVKPPAVYLKFASESFTPGPPELHARSITRDRTARLFVNPQGSGRDRPMAIVRNKVFLSGVDLVRQAGFRLQLRSPHLRRWPWWSKRSSTAVTAALWPSRFPQFSTGRLEVRSVLPRSQRRMTSSSSAVGPFPGLIASVFRIFNRRQQNFAFALPQRRRQHEGTSDDR